jgi:endonuclease III
MINFADIDYVYSKIDDSLQDAPRLYISHELKDIANLQEKSFKVLVSAVISLRTKEAITWDVSERLFAKVSTYQQLADLPLEELVQILYPCGFYKRKAIQLKNISKIIIEKYNNITPDNIEDLLFLPGVGRKVANLVVTEVYKKDGICVDIHVHRIANRWKWVSTKEADLTELQLRKVLPLKYWQTINQYLVLLGQNICLPRNPKCNICFLNNKCPSSTYNIK